MRSFLSLLLFLVACGPLVTVPGGRLSGEVAPSPTDWAFSDAVETVQLETRPEDPYSVNVWGVAIGATFYIAAGKSSNQWAQHIAADPHVRLQIEDTVYELRAERTEEQAELDAFLVAVKKKYDWEPELEQTTEASLFRLTPR